MRFLSNLHTAHNSLNVLASYIGSLWFTSLFLGITLEERRKGKGLRFWHHQTINFFYFPLNIGVLFISQYINIIFKSARYYSKFLFILFFLPHPVFFCFVFFLVWLSDAFVEHFTQVWYICVWTIVLLVFQTMITRRKDSPLSIQEDMSMHSALSFHRRKCFINIRRLAVILFWGFFFGCTVIITLFLPSLLLCSFPADLWLPLSKGNMAACAIG